MTVDVFRFVTLRAPQVPSTAPDAGANPVDIFVLAGGETELLRALRALVGHNANRQALVDEADKAQTTPEPGALDLTGLASWLHETRGHPFGTAELREALQSLYGDVPDVIASGAPFRMRARQAADDLLAHTIGARRPPRVVQQALSDARLLALIADARTLSDASLRSGLVTRRRVCLPSDVFVAWPANQPRADLHEARAEQVRKQQAELRDTVTRLQALDRASQELAELLRRGVRGKEPTPASAAIRPTAATAEVRAATPGARAEPMLAPDLEGPPASLAAAELTPATRELLDERGLDPDQQGTPEVLYRIDLERQELAHATLLATPDPRVVTVGDGGTVAPLPPRIAPTTSLAPGNRPPDLPEPPSPSEPTVPSGVGHVHAMAVADLMVTRQRLVGYEAGDIAHIENVLKGELKERMHRSSLLREEETVSESERIEEGTQDLSTNERFELQREAEQVLSTESQFETSASIGGSLGPFSGEASVRFARSTSREDASRSATSFAREIASRSVTRLQQRVLERRSVRVVSETEETNTHRFDNQGGADHVVGVYRWVDAVYEAQVVNYGRRLLLEAIVPEPSAFWHHARATSPLEGLDLHKPVPPGFSALDSDETLPLSPGLLTETNYLYFAGRYGVKDTQPPPARFCTAATTLEQSFSDAAERAHTKASDVLAVPDGYLARWVWVNGNTVFFTNPNSQVHVYVGRHRVAGSCPLDGESGTIPIAVAGLYVGGYAYNIEVLCERSPQLFAKWQADTYAAIMAAYDEQQAVYDRELEQRRAAADQSRTSNPEGNRLIIERELRRGAIGILSGQQFEDFDAMRRDVQPHGFPEVCFSEAEAESTFISFFEEAFDWRNMSFRFYPYQWARKDEWPLLATIEDSDPLFGSFLKSGRPGYGFR